MLSCYAAGLYKPPTRLKGQIRLTDNEVRTTMKVSKIINFDFKNIKNLDVAFNDFL
jgi:hypothetical protein